MKSIYNEYLVPNHPDYLALDAKFYETLRSLLKEAQDKDLNIREVSHQFCALTLAVESELVILRAAEKRNKERISWLMLHVDDATDEGQELIQLFYNSRIKYKLIKDHPEKPFAVYDRQTFNGITAIKNLFHELWKTV